MHLKHKTCRACNIRTFICRHDAYLPSARSLTSPSKHRRGDSSNPNHIIIPFPGQLVEIMVDVGDVIAKNDIVAVVKQMKMELEIRASRSGIVSWVYEGDEDDEVSEGVLVAKVIEEISNRAKL